MFCHPQVFSARRLVHTATRQRVQCPEMLIALVLLAAAALMSEVYDDHKDKDGFLYITYSGEHTFG